MAKNINDSKEFRVKLGENIRKARIKKGLTQAQLGEMLGKSDNVITNWEKGTNRPDADMIEKLCNILNISPNELLNWQKPTSTPTTIAAHIPEGVELTEEDMKQINDFIQFIVEKKKKGQK